LNGFTIGLTGGFLVAIFELHVFTAIKRRFSFITTLLLKTIAYLFVFVLLILLVINFNESWYYNISISENFNSQSFQYFLIQGDFKIIVLYSFLSVVTIIFTREMSRKMGQGVFLNYLTGKYQTPKEEQRIFMFLDQKSSTSHTEEMTSLGYYEFLKEFYFDITNCILSSGGQIYRYVGDQVVVSWTIKRGLRNADCIRCYFWICAEIENRKEKYLSKYGILPEFRASIHVGHVICGEVGSAKSQIVFHGEALYETALIEKECSKLEVDMLISEDLAELVALPVIYELQEVTKFQATANSAPQKLFTVREAVLDYL
jgi:adenylate cyclase